MNDMKNSHVTVRDFQSSLSTRRAKSKSEKNMFVPKLEKFERSYPVILKKDDYVRCEKHPFRETQP